MDATRFDRLARALGAVGGRRAVLRAALAAVGVGLVGIAADDADVEAARRKRRNGRGSGRGQPRGSALAAERKKKKKRCKPKCQGKVCGPNGCTGKRAGVCGTCSPTTRCDAGGRCVGCRDAADCAARPCNTVACQDETCVYTPVASDPACVAPHQCFAGICVECRIATDCPARTCEDAACNAFGACVYTTSGDGVSCGGANDICCGGACIDTTSDEDHCGACGNSCGQDACINSVCCTVCASGCPFSSVQAAVGAASPGASIRICPGTYVGRVTINKNLTLRGRGAAAVNTVLSNAVAPIIQVDSGAIVTVSNLSVTGATSGDVAAVRNVGALTLQAVQIFDNTSSPLSSGAGGGLNNGGTLVLEDCVVSENEATQGAGMANFGDATLVRTEFRTNTASFGGGVSQTFAGAILRLTLSSKINFNQATGGFGGGVFADANTAVTVDAASSIANNSPDNCSGAGCPS